MNKYFNSIMRNFVDKKPAIHFIGIGGIGMSALAGICIEYGYKVSGSDLSDNENIRHLKQKGADIFLYHSEKNVLESDIVIFSSAIKPDNPEIVKALKSGKCVIERHKFLGVIFNCFENSIAVSGSHGKTTACGFITQILLEADSDPQVLIGGNMSVIGGNYRKGNGCCIAEACEYKRNFLSLKPKIAVVLNIENDHMDYFKDSNDVTEAYRSFFRNTRQGGSKVINGDDKNCLLLKDSGCITYGFNANNNCRAVNIKKYRGRYAFTLIHNEKELNIKLSVCGRHNIYNALAAYCCASAMGINDKIIVRAIYNYKGISRRFEYKGRANGAAVICDYAHHPSEIKAVLHCARDMYKGRITAVFQPHTYTRTKALMDDFAESFDNADNVVLLPVYAARENYDAEGSSAALYKRIKARKDAVMYLDSINQLELYIRQNKSSCVLLLGAGDIVKLADIITEKVL